jgi:hypothetical protein
MRAAHPDREAARSILHHLLGAIPTSPCAPREAAEFVHEGEALHKLVDANQLPPTLEKRLESQAAPSPRSTGCINVVCSVPWPGDQISAVPPEWSLEFETLPELSSRFINLPPGHVDHEIEDALRRVCESLEMTARCSGSVGNARRFAYPLLLRRRAFASPTR